MLSWRLLNTMDVTFCVSALEEALTRFGKPEIFNTDQGGQFTSTAFTGVLSKAGVKISMDGRQILVESCRQRLHGAPAEVIEAAGVEKPSSVVLCASVDSTKLTPISLGELAIPFVQVEPVGLAVDLDRHAPLPRRHEDALEIDVDAVALADEPAGRVRQSPISRDGGCPSPAAGARFAFAARARGEVEPAQRGIRQIEPPVVENSTSTELKTTVPDRVSFSWAILSTCSASRFSSRPCATVPRPSLALV